MARVQAGEREALDEVVERFWDSLVAYAARLLGDQDSAEDVVQEAILRFWVSRGSWTPTQRLDGFLYQTTRNLALNELERREVRSRWAARGIGQARRSPLTPSEVIEMHEFRTLIEGAILELPPRRREVFLLARVHGKSYREIAEIMEIAPQTVANHVSAALSDLRKSLGLQLGDLCR